MLKYLIFISRYNVKWLKHNNSISKYHIGNTEQSSLNSETMNRTRSQLHFFIFWSLLCLSLQVRVKNISSAVARQIRSIGFPEGSGMGIFFALAIPIDIPDKSISVSYYFEANYALPGDKNSTYFEDYLQKRSIDRRLAYNIMERKLESAGYPGKPCLLRTICEAAENPLIENGLIGDILHILFTPSASQDENLPIEIKEAEFVKNCEEFYSKCPVSLLDKISIKSEDLK